jgi:cytochrome oxidase Cu insertion factor (SCO1/SenC/PrrC family)
LTEQGYNYDGFSFSMEDRTYPAWLRTAPALGQFTSDFTLADLDGHLHRLTDLRGRPVVIEIGSYTCPIFCAQIPPMQALATQHADAAFLVIYTR